eukprot:GFUD01064426.1.p1 GENE.GFUD01064426.1~~GFUD01064426.1.p1  ORF type:complete len:106 (-),score=24.39 GFUD01064426.1:36-353(-)
MNQKLFAIFCLLNLTLLQPTVARPERCSTLYHSECGTSQKEMEVEEDKVICNTVYDTKCEESNVGYSKKEKCSKWPREECTVTRVTVTKTIPDTRCQKIPTRICL